MATSALFAAGGCSRGPRDTNTTKIGVIQPLSGELGNFGKSVLQGVRLAIDDHNSAHPGQLIALAVEDSQGQPKLALSAFLKIRDVDHVLAIVGPLTSGEARSLLSTARVDNTVMISPTASTPSLSGASPYFFRVWPSDDVDGLVAAEYAINVLGLHRVGVLCVNNDFGVGLKQVFERAVKDRGGSIIFSDAYPEDNTDFGTALQVIASKQAELVYLPGHPRGIATVIRQARDRGLKTKFMSNVAAEDRDFLEVAGTAAAGLVFTAPTLDLDSKNPLFVSFRQRYKAKMNAEPDAHAAKGYDAAALLAAAVSNGNRTGDAIRQFLVSTPNFSFVSGDFRFDDKGDVVSPILIKSYLEPGRTAQNIATYGPVTKHIKVSGK